MSDATTTFEHRRPQRRREQGKAPAVLALVLAFVMIAAACGSNDGDGEATSTSGGEQTETGGEESTETTTVRGEDTREDESGPETGGTLTYGIEADSANPWVHYNTSYAISCRMILRMISDPLFGVGNDDKEAKPYLLESATISDDGLTHTFVARE